MLLEAEQALEASLELVAEPDAADAGGADLAAAKAEFIGDALGAVGGMLEGVGEDLGLGQNFDVTDLMNQPEAWHFIRQTVDAAGILFEQSDRNNTTGIWVRLGIGVPYSTGGPRPGV